MINVNEYKCKSFLSILICVASFMISLLVYPNIALAEHLPTVDITSPVSGSEVSESISVKVSYTIASGQVHSLTLYAGGVEVEEYDPQKRSGTYTFSLDTTGYPNGNLAISVKACSADDNSGHCTTDNVNVVVDNTSHGDAPWIEFISPEDGETLSGVVIVSADFEYLYNYNRNIYLYANGVEAGRVNVNVKVGSVTYSLDTTDYPDGALTLVVSECPPIGGGEWCRQDTVNVIIDNVEEDTEAPTIDITDPSANELIGAKPVAIAAELSDNVAIAPSTVAVKLDGTSVTSQCAVTAFSVSCMLSPSDGAHTVTIDCKDTSNNSAAQKSVNFTLDTISPNLSVTSHTNGQTVNTASINLVGTATDATSGVVSVEVNGTAAALNGEAWTLANFALDEGANPITVIAEDRVGNIKTVVLTVNYVVPDTEKPTIEIEEPADNEIIDAKPVIVTADLSDNLGIDISTIVVNLDGVAVTSQCTLTAVSLSCTLNPSDGEYTVTIDCKDTFGNSATQKSVSFTLDTMPPNLAITSHTNGQTVNTALINLTGAASDAVSGISSVEVNGAAAAFNNGSWALNGLALSEGANLIVVVAEDKAGHVTTSTITIIYTIPDTQKPVISITEPAENQLLGAKPVVVSADLTDNVAVDKNTVIVKLDGIDVTPQCVITVLSLTCSLSPSDGNHSMTVDCKDTSGNSATQKSAGFTLDTTSPVVAISSHTNGQEVNTSAINLTGTVSDATSGIASVEVDGNTATVSGMSWTLNNYALSEGPNAITVVAEDNAGNMNTITINVTYVPITCWADSDCNDSDPLTFDECVNPGTGLSQCTNSSIACNTETDCTDDARFCVNGGTLSALCVVCTGNNECDDDNAHTEDSCANSGTASAACVHNQIVCLDDSECDDGNTLTQDKCNSAGTTQSYCTNSPFACNNDSDCRDNNPLTIEKCNNSGTLNSSCSYTLIECNTDADCDDQNVRTYDTCSNGGAESAQCLHAAIECDTEQDCNDGSALTIDSCSNGGTINSECAHTTIQCNNDSDCPDANPLTIDKCNDGGTAQASCAHTVIACNANADCDDGNNNTFDACSNGGTVSAVCNHDGIACNTNADCDDGNILTEDTCGNPGTVSASCEHSACGVACASNADCNDNNTLTTDTCVAPGTCSAVCEHVACNVTCDSDNECDDHNDHTTDKCVDSGTCNASCSHTQIVPPGKPTLTIITPQDGLLTNKPKLTVSGETTGNRVTINGREAELHNGVFSAEMILGEGRNQINVTAYGERYVKTVEMITVTLDTKPPVIRNVKPRDGTVFNSERTIFELSADIDDQGMGSGVESTEINVTVNGEEAAVRYNAKTGVMTAAIEADESPIVVQIEVTDRAGNSMAPLVLNYTLKNSHNQQAHPDGFVLSTFDDGKYSLLFSDDGQVERITQDSRDYLGHPTYSKSAGYVIFTRNVHGANKLFAADLTGDSDGIQVLNIRPVGNIFEESDFASIDSAGRKLAYLTERWKGQKLYLKELGREKSSKLLAKDMGWIVMPAISPVGDKVVFSSDKAGEFGLYIVDTNGGASPVPIAPAGKGIDIDPVFSPDGQSIYFVSNRDGNFDVYRYNVTNRAVDRITDTPEREVRLSFTTEGELVCSIRNGDDYGIYEIDVRTGAESELVSRPGNSLTR